MNYKTSGVITDMNRTEYTYDKMGRVLTKTEKYIKPGTTTWINTIIAAFEYDESGNVIKQYDALGYITSPQYYASMTYDMQNRQTLVTDAVGNTVKYEYDGIGRKISETDGRGNITIYTYDEMGNIITAASGSGADAKTLSKTYDLLGNVLTSTDGNGKITTYTYNAFGKVKTVTQASDGTIPANTITYRYTIDGKSGNEIDSLSHEILYAYDANGRLAAKTSRNANGTAAIALTYKYDKNGNLKYGTDGRGNVTTYVYDALNRAVSVSSTVNGAVRTSQKTYDANGNVTIETDWYGNQKKYEYDPLGRVTKKTDENNVIVETLEYNENGLQTTSKDALNNITTYEYDKLGRVIKTIDPLGHTTQTSYDANGNAITKTDGKGYVMTYVYDSFNRLTQVKDPDGNVLTTYTYDKNDNMLTQTDRGANVTTMAYNARNLLISRTVNGMTVSYAYRADGSVATDTDQKGIITTYNYDIHGRLTSKVKGASTVSYTYDNDGNELTMSSGAETTTRTYDMLNRVLTKTVTVGGVNYTTTFGYDITSGQSAGYYAETTTDAKGNVTTRVYDKTKRLYSVTAGGTTTYAYYANGATQKITYPGGASEEYSYYADGRLNALTNKKADGSIIEAYNYGYDANGNIAQKLDGLGTTTYIYDKMDRVLTVSEPNGRVTTYTYNNCGDRASETTVFSGASIAKTYNYGVRGWLMNTVEVNGEVTTKASYYYDANGNQISRVSEETSPESGEPLSGLSHYSDYAAYYSYDEWNNMTQSISGANTAENYYDGDGLRYGKTVNGGDMTVSLYEYSDIVLEVNAATGAQTAVNVYGNQLISRNGQYYMNNGHGDVTAILNAGGNIVASYYYDAFGVHQSVTGTADNPYRYSGYLFDEETGLYYLKSRYYDPETARFLQEDTYRGSAGDPLSLNLYLYVKYNPLKYSDPTGHWEQGDELLPKKAQDLIQQYTDAYYAAEANGDTKGMGYAHAAANTVREKYSHAQTATTKSGEIYSSTILNSDYSDSSGNYMTAEMWEAAKKQAATTPPTSTTPSGGTNVNNTPQNQTSSNNNSNSKNTNEVEVNNNNNPIIIIPAPPVVVPSAITPNNNLENNYWKENNDGSRTGAGGNIGNSNQSNGGEIRNSNDTRNGGGTTDRNGGGPRNDNVQNGSQNGGGVRGSLTIIEGGNYSESEINAAKYMHDLGNDVTLRPPTGTRAGGATSDLIVNGVNYDVYTPVTSNQSSIISAIAKKNSQTTGIVLDLSKTSVTVSDLGNILGRVKGSIEAGGKVCNIKYIVVMPK